MIFCSTVIPTIGRPSLERAVESVLAQDFAANSIEIIVVNDSGRPLPAAKWQTSNCVRIVHTNRSNRSVARNCGAALAQGQYLHFLDDDDWMMPGAFACLEQLANRSQSAWVYGGYRLVDNDGVLLVDICPDLQGNTLVQLLGSEWLPLQASWIRYDAFWHVGGFASLTSLLGGYEDIDLCRQIALTGDVAGEDTIVTCIRTGDQGSTTDYGNLLNQNRKSREKVLESPGAYHRMRASADDSYWYGRLAYYYMTSMKWNWQHQRRITVVSRLLYVVAAVVYAGRHLLSPRYWQGATRPHFNQTQIAIESTNRDLFTQTAWK